MPQFLKHDGRFCVAYVTGPAHVYLGLCFGESVPSPKLVRLQGASARKSLDEDKILEAARLGVADAALRACAVKFMGATGWATTLHDGWFGLLRQSLISRCVSGHRCTPIFILWGRSAPAWNPIKIPRAGQSRSSVQIKENPVEPHRSRRRPPWATSVAALLGRTKAPQPLPRRLF